MRIFRARKTSGAHDRVRSARRIVTKRVAFPIVVSQLPDYLTERPGLVDFDLHSLNLDDLEIEQLEQRIELGLLFVQPVDTSCGENTCNTFTGNDWCAANRCKTNT